MSRLSLLVCLVLLSPPVRAEDGPYLFQKPTVSKTQIVFAFADDPWIAPRSGGDAVRLTTGPGIETDPIFSPDGKQIAFTAEYEGNFDVYLVPAEGGQPRRLTYHPGTDRAVGWSPDGKSVLISSMRDSHSRVPRLFTMPVDGVLPSPLPLPMGDQGDLSPDGQFIAYVPFPPAFRIWKRYQGGRTTPIWIRSRNPCGACWTTRGWI